MDESGQRYSRQTLLAELGREGQERLLQATLLIVGCGALGSHLANLAARAGIGRIRLADRDVVELSNLHRQVLFDERDAADSVPKAIAAARRLERVNRDVELEPHVVDVAPDNVASLAEGVDVVLDGTDNLETRYLLNDVCLELSVPWVYAGVVGTRGVTLTVRPGAGPCLRCLFPEPPPAGTLPTCDTVGVLGTAPALLASLQVTEAIKLLVDPERVGAQLLQIDLWRRSFRAVDVQRDASCPACAHGRRDFLLAEVTSWTTTLCGRNAVQVSPPSDAAIDLERLAARLARGGTVRRDGYLLRFDVDGRELMVFPDGRAIVLSTTDESEARALYCRYLGM